MQNATITIRKGAAHYDMTIEEESGTSYFDFAGMTKGERKKVQRLTTSALASAGRLAKPKAGGFKRRGKANSRKRRPNHANRVRQQRAASAS